MTHWRPDYDPSHLYFVTLAAVQRRHLFKREIVRRLLIDCLDCLRLRGRLKLYAFVLMPNHFHLIVQCTAEDPLADVLRDLKKYIAERVIRHYRVARNQQVLDYLASAVPYTSKQRYKVWEDGYDARDVFSPDFLRQKMTHVHNNPCQPHSALAEHPEEYVWSSARFYLKQEPALIPVDNANPLLV